MPRDQEAEFTALVHRQSRFAYRVAYGVLLHAQDSEDATQELFLKLYRNGGWQQARNERAFIASAAWRIAMDRRGSAARAATVPDAFEDAISPQQGPESATIAADRQAQVHSLIDALPEDLRMPLILSAMEELNSREIAGILNIPEGTVRTRLQRARSVLREKLAAHETRILRIAKEPRHA